MILLLSYESSTNLVMSSASRATNNVHIVKDTDTFGENNADICML